jgi:hypothetical protein
VLGAGQEARRRAVGYHEDDLRQIKAARKAAAPAVFTDAEGTWLFASEVARRFGLRADNLWHFRAKVYDFLPEGRIRAKQVDAASPPTRKARCRLWVYHEDDVKRVAAHRAGEPIPPPAIVMIADSTPSPNPSAQERPSADIPESGRPTKPRRGRPPGTGLSTERKEEIAEAYLNRQPGETGEDIADRFKVSESTVDKVTAWYRGQRRK